MIKIRTNLGLVDLAKDIRREYMDGAAWGFSMLDALSLLDKPPSSADLIREARDTAISHLDNYITYMVKSRYPIPHSVRMLQAHGKQGGDAYEFSDGKGIWTPVDTWLDQHDGKYDALFITSCNSNEIQLQPRKSLIIYPTGDNEALTVTEAALYGKSDILTILSPKK